MIKKGDGVRWCLLIASWAMIVFGVGMHIQQFRITNPVIVAGNSQGETASRTLNINRTYSDIDGREVTNPTVTFADGTYIFGSVIVRQLRDDTWMVKIKPDDAKKSEMTVIVDVVTESATYFDLGPSPDNPGAIRS